MSQSFYRKGIATSSFSARERGRSCLALCDPEFRAGEAGDLHRQYTDFEFRLRPPCELPKPVYELPNCDIRLWSSCRFMPLPSLCTSPFVDVIRIRIGHVIYLSPPNTCFPLFVPNLQTPFNPQFLSRTGSFRSTPR
jgi:hypothetical protein